MHRHFHNLHETYQIIVLKIPEGIECFSFLSSQQKGKTQRPQRLSGELDILQDPFRVKFKPPLFGVVVNSNTVLG